MKNLNGLGHAGELLFEFRAAVHSLPQHKVVKWTPNIGSKSEFDLRVISNSDKIVSIECTYRKSEANSRMRKRELSQILLNTIASKNKQVKKRKPELPVMIAILLPDAIDWHTHDLREQLKVNVRFLFD